MTLGSKFKVKLLMDLTAQYFYIFRWRVFIYDAVIAFGHHMTTKVSDGHYNLGVNAHC